MDLGKGARGGLLSTGGCCPAMTGCVTDNVDGKGMCGIGGGICNGACEGIVIGTGTLPGKGTKPCGKGTKPAGGATPGGRFRICGVDPGADAGVTGGAVGGAAGGADGGGGANVGGGAKAGGGAKSGGGAKVGGGGRTGGVG